MASKCCNIGLVSTSSDQVQVIFEPLTSLHGLCSPLTLLYLFFVAVYAVKTLNSVRCIPIFAALQVWQ